MKFRKIVNMLSLPDEIIYNLPYITITGTESIIIENYTGIIEYTQNKARVKTPCGILKITGEKLFLKEISKNIIEIEGTISKWEYI